MFSGLFQHRCRQTVSEKNFTSSKKALEDSMIPTVGKCVKVKSKIQLKCFIFLKSVIYFGVSATVKTVLIKANDL